MKRPLISVVIPVLNERDRVGTLVGELRHANSAPFEIIVIDGGSNDGTIEAAQNLDAQAAITIGVSEPGRGPQLVAGAAQAAGDILWFLHVDSHVAPGALDRIRAAIDEDGWVAGIFARSLTATTGFRHGSPASTRGSGVVVFITAIHAFLSAAISMTRSGAFSRWP